MFCSIFTTSIYESCLKLQQFPMWCNWSILRSGNKNLSQKSLRRKLGLQSLDIIEQNPAWFMNTATLCCRNRCHLALGQNRWDSWYVSWTQRTDQANSAAHTIPSRQCHSVLQWNSLQCHYANPWWNPTQQLRPTSKAADPTGFPFSDQWTLPGHWCSNLSGRK